VPAYTHNMMDTKNCTPRPASAHGECSPGGVERGGGGTFYASYRRLMKPTGSRITDDTDTLPKL